MATAFVGNYDRGRYVKILDKSRLEELERLGFYGLTLDTARRKDPIRRGPTDLHVVLYTQNNQSNEDPILLTLHEAFFLVHALGYLKIVLDVAPTRPLSILDCWKEFRGSNPITSNCPDFVIEYGVYYYFRSRGWKVRSGENYGANFLLYKGGPSIDHAQYAVVIIDETKDDSQLSNWKTVLTHHRVVQSVSKRLLLAHVTKDRSESVFEHPNQIKHMLIRTTIFSAGTTITI